METIALLSKMESKKQPKISDYQKGNITSISTSFKIIELAPNNLITQIKADTNYIYFVMSGEALVKNNLNAVQSLKSLNMSLVSKDISYSISALKQTKLIQFSFDYIYDNQQRELIKNHCETHKDNVPELVTIRINKQLKLFLQLIEEYDSQEVKCFDFNIIKHKELITLMNTFYSPKQLSDLFFPIMSKSEDFKSFILSNYKKVDYNVSELIALSNMSTSNFFTTFKEIFGMTAKQWLLKQYATTIASLAACEGMTVSNLMAIMDVKSPCHFFRTCKQFFGCTPKQLIIKSKANKITQKRIAENEY